MRHSLTQSVQTFVWSLTDFLECTDLYALGLVTKSDSRCMQDLWTWCHARHLHTKVSGVPPSAVKILRAHSHPSMQAYYTQWTIQRIRAFLLRIRSQCIGINRAFRCDIGYRSNELSCMYNFRMAWNHVECALCEKPERHPISFLPNPQGVCTQVWLPALKFYHGLVRCNNIMAAAYLWLYLLVEHAGTCDVFVTDWWTQESFHEVCRELGAEIPTGTDWNIRPWRHWTSLL